MFTRIFDFLRILKSKNYQNINKVFLLTKNNIHLENQIGKPDWESRLGFQIGIPKNNKIK